MTTSVNKPLSDGEQIFFDLVWTPIVMSGETALFAEIPILNAPVLGSIDREIISLASKWLFDQIRLITDITAINLINEEHRIAYADASVNLMQIVKTKGVNSPEYTEALNAAKIALSKFTSFNK